MRAGGFLNIRLPPLLLLITASYRCHPQTSPCLTERCHRGSPLWDSARGSPGCPSPARGDATGPSEPLAPTPAAEGSAKASRDGARGRDPHTRLPIQLLQVVSGAFSSPAAAGGGSGEGTVPPSRLLPSLAFKTSLRKAESKSRDSRPQLQVHYNGLLNQFAPL